AMGATRPRRGDPGVFAGAADPFWACGAVRAIPGSAVACAAFSPGPRCVHPARDASLYSAADDYAPGARLSVRNGVCGFFRVLATGAVDRAHLDPLCQRPPGS